VSPSAFNRSDPGFHKCKHLSENNLIHLNRL
jgi:hypothetical protein